mgnify:CR=1 FL=1
MTNILLTLINYTIFAFFASAISNFWQYIIQKGQFLSIVSERLLPYLKTRNTLLYKALGGCSNCNLMWLAILLVFPLFWWIVIPLSILAKTKRAIALLWLMMPILSLKMKQVSNPQNNNNIKISFNENFDVQATEDINENDNE